MSCVRVEEGNILFRQAHADFHTLILPEVYDLEAIDGPPAKNGTSGPNIIVLVLRTGFLLTRVGSRPWLDVNPSVRKIRSQHTGSQVHPVHARMSRNYCELVAPRKPFQTARRPRRSLGLRYSWRGRGQDLNLRPSGYETYFDDLTSGGRWTDVVPIYALSWANVHLTVPGQG